MLRQLLLVTLGLAVSFKGTAEAVTSAPTTPTPRPTPLVEATKEPTSEGGGATMGPTSEGGGGDEELSYAPTLLPTRAPTPVPGSSSGDGHVECPGFSFGSNTHCDCEGDCEEYAGSWCGCAAARASSCCNTPAGDDESSAPSVGPTLPPTSSPGSPSGGDDESSAPSMIPTLFPTSSPGSTSVDPTGLCVGEIRSMNARCNPIKNRADCEKEGQSFFSKDGVCNWEEGGVDDGTSAPSYVPTFSPTRGPTPAPVETVELLCETDAVVNGRKLKGKNNASKLASLCECEELCRITEGWGVTYKPHKKKPQKSKCWCHIRKPRKVRDKKSKSTQYIVFDM